MREPDPHRRGVFKAVSAGTLAGFACVLLDADPAWGALLDNLHVTPALKRHGIGRQLFDHVREWVDVTAPGTSLHLTVIEANMNARRFYDSLGGAIVERTVTRHMPGTELAVLRYRWEPLSLSSKP
jgi:GNAT superfamily N-acetyltransferase